MKRALAIVALFSCFCTLSGGQATPQLQRIEIVAKKFEFSPSEITLAKGQPVTLVLTSEDVPHGLTIKELNLKAEFKKDKPAEVTFTPAQAGDFVGKCSKFCGRGHGTMKLRVHVR
jgi:cytochrome c oxidase subunit 2